MDRSEKGRHGGHRDVAELRVELRALNGEAASRVLKRLLDTRSGQAAGSLGEVVGFRGSSAESAARELLGAAEPCHSHPLQKHRVWLRMSRASARRSFAFGRTAMAMGIVVLLLGGTAIASAALGQWPGWAVRAYEQLIHSSTTASLSSSVTVSGAPVGHGRKRARAGGLGGVAQSEARDSNGSLAASAEMDVASPELPTPAAQIERRPAPSPAAGPIVATAPSNLREGAGRRESATARPPRRLAQVAAAGEDDRPVLAAMRALRRDRDPVRARALLWNYLADHPNGALAEEALAITIEAAVAHHDADAQALAARYLQIYPAGPFRSLALQTLSGRRETAPARR